MALAEQLSRSAVSIGLEKDGYGYRIEPYSPSLPETWKIADGETLSVQDRANLVMLNLVADVVDPLADLVDIGFGKKIIGGVFKRPEDDQIRLDETAQELAQKSLRMSGRRYKIPFHVMAEHGSFRVGKHLKKDAIGVLDPIDNSDEHNRGYEGQSGLDTPQHLVYAMYDTANNPLGAVDINLYTRHVTINRDGRNYQYNPRTNELSELVTPPEVTTIKQREFVLATYEGRPVYEKLFHKFLPGITEDRHEKSTKHAKGGSHIYSSMASGAVSAYAMFKEPRGEIDQGLPFALSAGYKAYSVNLDTGDLVPYTFSPVLHSRKKNVPFFIVARTEALAQEIVSHYMDVKEGMDPAEFASYKASILKEAA